MTTNPDGGGPASQDLFGLTARTTIYQVISNLTAAVAAVVSARHLGPEGRGALVLYLTVGSLTVLVSSLGVNTSCRLLLVDREEPVALGDFLGLSTALAVVQAVVCSLVGVALIPLADVQVSVGDAFLLGLLGAGMLAQFLMGEAVNAYGLISVAAGIQGIASAGQLAAIIALAALDVPTVEPFVLAFAAGSFLHVALFLVALTRVGAGLRPSQDWGSWRRLVRGGVPAVAVNVGQVLTFRVDRYLVGVFLGPAAVGVYSVASTAPELLRLPTLALGQPIFHRLASGSARLPDFRRSRAICLLTVAALAALVAVFAPVLIRTVFGPEFSGAVAPLRILLLGEIGISLYYLDGSALFGLGRVSDVARAAVAALVIVVVADLVLVPAWGIAGAAWASVPAYSAMGLVTYRYLRRASAGPPRPAAVPRTGELEVEPRRRLDA